MVQPQGTQHFLDGVEAVVRGQVRKGVEAQMYVMCVKMFPVLFTCSKGACLPPNNCAPNAFFVREGKHELSNTEAASKMVTV